MKKHALRIFVTSALFAPSNVWADLGALASAGFGSSHQFVSGGAIYSLPFDLLESVRIRPGAGGRLSVFHATKRKYQTGGTKDREDRGIEYISVKNAQHYAANIAVMIEAEFLPYHLLVGFNIDGVGYSFGPKRSANDVELDPSSVNLLRYGYNDLGSLHSETYLGYRVETMKTVFRMGTTHSSTQYRVRSTNAPYSTRRFLNFSDTFFVGIAASLN